MKLRSPEGLTELEKQPAYLRRGVKLSQTDSDGTEVSRYSINNNQENPDYALTIPICTTMWTKLQTKKMEQCIIEYLA